jgi:ketosteroid isomerase-like protein
MSKIIYAGLLAVSALFFTVAHVSPGLAGSPEEDVKAAYAAWDAAFAKADPKAISAFYTDDALLMPPSHEVIRGPAGVEKFFTGVFGVGGTAHKLDLIEARADGTLVYGTAKWSAKGKDAQGKEQPWGGLATHIFKRQPDGSLKLIVHTFN